jgi:hypothetical protein
VFQFPFPAALTLHRFRKILHPTRGFGLQEIMADPPDRLLAGVAIQLLGAAVPEKNRPFPCPHQHWLEGLIDERLPETGRLRTHLCLPSNPVRLADQYREGKTRDEEKHQARRVLGAQSPEVSQYENLRPRSPQSKRRHRGQGTRIPGDQHQREVENGKRKLMAKQP